MGETLRPLYHFIEILSNDIRIFYLYELPQIRAGIIKRSHHRM
ncbi:hypothetical protein LEP1GSC058_1554 [Leptospira fainei serovar Hurstbridge str. BUT 6]|uniref:Uncharacterized protein n=1 Tax=Leptospira fainei serovar Hurstbridge str. BUT 6 TaxID=1193011 RepID=S3VER5_9LEPT|nr:hypothetical protein LEP1GSC058_1554 [Leptospira fainei serovar Hurstbridge str. BUT 6]